MTEIITRVSSADFKRNPQQCLDRAAAGEIMQIVELGVILMSQGSYQTTAELLSDPENAAVIAEQLKIANQQK